MMKKILLIVLSVLVLLFVVSCTSSQIGDEKEAELFVDQINVVATTGMISDIVGNVGGPRVAVTGLMGPGVDPHLYKARESDVRALQKADVIFYNGLHLEAQLGEVLEKMGEKRTVVAVAGDLPEEVLLDFSGYPGLYDPHVWFDVILWKHAVENVRDTLKEHDPEHANLFEARATSYLKVLDSLHSYVQEKVASVPEEQRVLITAHDAFSYFGKAYGFEVKGLQGISTESEAGTKDVQDLATFIAERQIKAIFVESSVPERNIKAVQEAVQAQGWDVQVGGELFSDAMGDEGTLEGTYYGMVEHNIDTIAGALSGEGEMHE